MQTGIVMVKNTGGYQMKAKRGVAVSWEVASVVPCHRSMAFHAAIIGAFASLLLLGFSPAAHAELTWGNKGSKCDGPHRIEYARLWGLGLGTDWKAICRATPASGISALSNGKRPSYCVDKAALGIWGEWKYSNHASCGAHFAAPKPTGCFGPNRQVMSARLEGDLGGRSWENACQATNGPGNLGRPDRCVKDALSTGIWGEWYTGQACAKPLQWGNWKDNGCVRDMQRADANAGGISVEGMRSYSAVLWNVGGDWMEACRHARIDLTGADSRDGLTGPTCSSENELAPPSDETTGVQSMSIHPRTHCCLGGVLRTLRVAGPVSAATVETFANVGWASGAGFDGEVDGPVGSGVGRDRCESYAA